MCVDFNSTGSEFRNVRPDTRTCCGYFIDKRTRRDDVIDDGVIDDDVIHDDVFETPIKCKNVEKNLGYWMVIAFLFFKHL